jgi:hypothetical protein
MRTGSRVHLSESRKRQEMYALPNKQVICVVGHGFVAIANSDVSRKSESVDASPRAGLPALVDRWDYFINLSPMRAPCLAGFRTQESAKTSDNRPTAETAAIENDPSGRRHHPCCRLVH